MQYEAVAIYRLDGAFMGYSIVNVAARKLKTTNLWSDEEQPQLQEQLDRLNVDTVLRAHWPRIDDPEVVALLGDPTWEPLETQVVDAVDDEHSHYVWQEVPEVDKTGAETGGTVRGDLDEEASVIAFKKVEAPVRPIDAQIRTRKAQEIVARRRAGR